MSADGRLGCTRAGAVIATFQAGHASSILVTRSRASALVNALSAPKLFKHVDDKNNQAGHLFFMIIGARPPMRLVRRDFMSCESGGVKVDHVCSVPNSGPIVTSFGFENRPLRLSSLECGLARARCPSSVGPGSPFRSRITGMCDASGASSVQLTSTLHGLAAMIGIALQIWATCRRSLGDPAANAICGTTTHRSP
jgi:hypothetical protein